MFIVALHRIEAGERIKNGILDEEGAATMIQEAILSQPLITNSGLQPLAERSGQLGLGSGREGLLAEVPLSRFPSLLMILLPA